jgi:hypothetical protein
MINPLDKTFHRIGNGFFQKLTQVLFGMGLLGSWGLAYWPMLQGGYPYVHSIGSNAVWAFQFALQVGSGQIYPRWLEQSFASLGSPTLVFYPPMFLYATLPFAGLGWPVLDRLVGSTGVALLALAVGAYLYAQTLFAKERGWILLCTSLMLLSPYFLVNIHIRGAMGEMWAMVGICWSFWGLQVRLQGDESWRWIPVTLSIALIGFSHVPTLLLFACFWGSLPFILTLAVGRQSWQKTIDTFRYWSCCLYGSLGMGLGLACVFLLPAFLERTQVNLGYMQFALPQNRLLVPSLWPLAFSTQEFDRTLIPIFGVTLISSLCLGILLRFTQVKPRFLPQVYLLLWGASLPLLMTTPLAQALYTHVEIFERIQFSWRWLAIAGVSWPFLIGILVSQSGSLFSSRILRYLCQGILLVILSVVQGGLYLQVERQVIVWPEKVAEINTFFAKRPPFPEEVDLQAKPYRNIDWGMLENSRRHPFMTDVSEYTPKWIPDPPHLPERTYKLVEWEKGSGEITHLVWKPGFRSFQVTSALPGSLRLRSYTWPGWAVYLNRYRIQIEAAADGRLRIPIKEGKTQVQIIYQGTPAEQWGLALSGLSGLVLLRGRIPLPQFSYRSQKD